MLHTIHISGQVKREKEQYIHAHSGGRDKNLAHAHSVSEKQFINLTPPTL